MERKQKLQLQEMVQFSKRTHNWNPIKFSKEIPYSFKSSLNGLDVYMHLGHGAMMPYFSIGIFNGENEVGSVECCICEDSPPEEESLIDYYDKIKKFCEKIGRSNSPKAKYFNYQKKEDIRRVRRTIKEITKRN